MTDHERTAALMLPTGMAPSKAPGAAFSWLTQSPAEVGVTAVAHLVRDRQTLMLHVHDGPVVALSSDLNTLHVALQKLDFSLLQSRSWWDRATGKSRSAGDVFAAQVEAVAASMRRLNGAATAFHQDSLVASNACERQLVGMEVDSKALDEVVEKGAKWLAEMQGQIQERHAGAVDDVQRQEVRRDAAQCAALVGRFKHLRAVSSATRQTNLLTRELNALHATLLQHLTQALPEAYRPWSARLPGLAAAVSGNSDGPELSLEVPMEAHEKLNAQVALTVTALLAVVGVQEAQAGSANQLSATLSTAQGS